MKAQEGREHFLASNEWSECALDTEMFPDNNTLQCGEAIAPAGLVCALLMRLREVCDPDNTKKVETQGSKTEAFPGASAAGSDARISILAKLCARSAPPKSPSKKAGTKRLSFPEREILDFLRDAAVSLYQATRALTGGLGHIPPIFWDELRNSVLDRRNLAHPFSPWFRLAESKTTSPKKAPGSCSSP